MAQGHVEEAGDVVHLVFLHAAGGEGWAAQTHTGGLEGRVGVEGDAVLVGGHAGPLEAGFGLVAQHAVVAEVHQEKVVVRAAADDAPAAILQALGQGLSVADHLVAVGLELGSHDLVQGHGLGRNHVHQGAALDAREDRAVKALGILGLAEDHAAAGAAQGLVGGGGDIIRVGHGARVVARGHQAGDVGHVHHEQGPHLVADLPKEGEIPGAAVGRGAHHDHLGLVLQGQGADLVHVDPLVLLAHVVGHEFVEDARAVQGVAVGQVAAVGEVQAHHRITGLQGGEVDGHVGLGAAVGLDIGVLGPEDLLGAVPGQVFDDVHLVAAAVVALARVALGVLVGEVGAHGLHDGAGRVVLRRDEFQVVALALNLQLQGLEHGGVGGSDHFVHGGGSW